MGSGYYRQPIQLGKFLEKDMRISRSSPLRENMTFHRSQSPVDSEQRVTAPGARYKLPSTHQSNIRPGIYLST